MSSDLENIAEVEPNEIELSEVITEEIMPQKKKPKKRSFSLEKRRAVAGYLFVAPFVIGFIVFMLYPLLTSLQWSMAGSGSGIKTVDILNSAGEVIGSKGTFVIPSYTFFGNYGQIISEDYDFTVSFLETIQRTFLWTPFIIAFSLFIAIMLNRKIKFRSVFRVIYFLPVLLGTGLVLSKLEPVTKMLEIPNSLIESAWYILDSGSIIGFLKDLIESIIGMFWKMGVQIVIFLAGLQSVSDTYYEAAKVDNANWWDQLWKITIPMLSPMILLNTVYTIIDSFRDQSNPIVAYILKQYNATKWVNVSAMGWMYFLVTLIMLGTVFAITRRFVFYEK